MGTERANHKYIDKVRTKNGKIRYIYKLGDSRKLGDFSGVSGASDYQVTKKKKRRSVTAEDLMRSYVNKSKRKSNTKKIEQKIQNRANNKRPDIQRDAMTQGVLWLNKVLGLNK